MKAIHAKHQSAEDHLRDVIETFLQGVEPTPTWRVIVDALRSPAVNLPNLAKQVETAHLPAIAVSTTRDVEESAPSDSKLTSMYVRCLLQFQCLYLSFNPGYKSAISETCSQLVRERDCN